MSGLKLVTAWEILSTFLFCFGSSRAAISCIGIDGKPTDWFIVYKMPKIKNGPSAYFRNGIGLMYMDDKRPAWIALDKSINDEQQPISYTVEQMFEIKKNNGSAGKTYVMYNDQTPNATSSSKAHAKGDLCFDKTSGFWMIHSVPSFPSFSDKERYPSSGKVYGQILMCVTFPTDQLDSIGTQLQFMNPQLYHYFISPYFQTASPNLWAFLVNGTRIVKNKKIKSYDNTLILKSLAGKKFISFAKSGHFGKDLYLDLVATKLESNLLVQSWLRGKGDLPSDCSSTYSVKNALKFNMKKMSFDNAQDHSKWAISDYIEKEINTSAKPPPVKHPYATSMNSNRDNDQSARKAKWFCIADINRQRSQTSRGGGALCFRNLGVWENFNNLVTEVAECSDQENINTTVSNSDHYSNAPSHQKGRRHLGSYNPGRHRDKKSEKESFNSIE